MLFLFCVSVRTLSTPFVYAGFLSLQNISDNIHTGIAFPSCVSVYGVWWVYFWENVSGNIHTGLVSACEDSVCVLPDNPWVQSFLDSLFTLIWFLFGVCEVVICQGVLTGKTFLAIFTLKWFLFRVCPYMNCKSRFQCKTFLTMFTLKWFFFRVCPYMNCKVSFPPKTFLTKFTLMLFVFCVNP